MDGTFSTQLPSNEHQDGMCNARFLWKLDHPYFPSNFSICERHIRDPTHHYTFLITPSKRLCNHTYTDSFDSSCRQRKRFVSLNDCLLIALPFLNDLCSILLNFQIPIFASSTDIIKAFLHVKLHNLDTDYMHFLWLSDVTNPMVT